MHRRGWITAVVGSVLLGGWGGSAFAQAPGATLSAAGKAGDCQIRVMAPTLASPARLEVALDRDVVFARKVRPGDLPRTVKVGEPIGTTTTVRVTLDHQTVIATIAPADGTSAGCDPVREDLDVFTASGFVGVSIDTFAAEDLQHYLNPSESGATRVRETAGVNFEYRVPLLRGRAQSLSIVGETIHGVKSTDVNCTENADLKGCANFLPGTDKFLSILRNATSLEANAGLRLHLFEVNGESPSPAVFYLQAKDGFLMVAGSDGDAAEQRTYSFGLLAMGGRYAGSYFDIGYGRSDLYKIHPNRRFKVDGLLSIQLGNASTVRPYIQMTVDADRGNGPDSIQTFIGFDFDLRRIFGK